MTAITTIDLLLKLWPLTLSTLTAIIGLVIWLVRLEGRVNANSEKVKILAEAIQEPLKKIGEMAGDIKAIKNDLDWLTGRKEKTH